MKILRVALDGCYPSFGRTDLIIRAIGALNPFRLVNIWDSPHLLIRGSFSQGSRSRVYRQFLLDKYQTLVRSTPLTLHVSSENACLPNYQSFSESKCHYGIGHEILLDQCNYLRIPHWWNYIDFTPDGFHSPNNWIRYGKAYTQEELLNPLQHNRSGSTSAAFITSYLNSLRTSILTSVSSILTVDCFGRPFDHTIKNHNSSSFQKRDLLAHYQYSLCPENSVGTGYSTEKIPESFAAGAIPISYGDQSLDIDFNPGSFINLHHISSPYTLAQELSVLLHDPEVIYSLLNTPLLRRPAEHDILLDFLRSIISIAFD